MAVQDLDEKEMHGDNGIEAALTPLVTDTTTGRQNSVGFELCGPILLELFNDFCNVRVILTLLYEGIGESPICTGEVEMMQNWQPPKKR